MDIQDIKDNGSEFICMDDVFIFLKKDRPIYKINGSKFLELCDYGDLDVLQRKFNEFGNVSFDIDFICNLDIFILYDDESIHLWAWGHRGVINLFFR